MHEYYKLWIKARDFEAGEEAVKAKRDLYLPLIESQLYDAYLERATLLAVIPKTISSMQGLVYRKDPEAILPPRLAYITKNANGSGKSLYTFVKEVFHQAVNPSRVGILVDMKKSTSTSNYPYFSLYKAEDIEEVLTSTENADEVIAIRLRESIATPDFTNFTQKNNTIYRDLILENGVYKQRILDSNKEVLEEIIPLSRGNPLNFIPFVFINGDGSLSHVACKPILLPLINLNLSHYRTTADIEHARHYTALPQLVLKGFSAPPDGIRKIGPSVILETSDTSASAEFIQPPSLDCLEKALEQKEKQMSMLGANIFMDFIASTATEAILKNSSINSVLMNLTVGVSDGVTQALVIADKILGGDGTNVSYELNTSFYNNQLNPQEIVTLSQLLTAGQISSDTFLRRLSALEVLPVGKTIDKEKLDINLDKTT